MNNFALCKVKNKKAARRLKNKSKVDTSGNLLRNNCANGANACTAIFRSFENLDNEQLTKSFRLFLGKEIVCFGF